MSLFNFSQEELLTFFAVLVRYSVLMAVLPFVGDKVVPGPVKVLLSVAITLALYPALVARGQVTPGEALAWGSTTGGIVSTIATEALFGLAMGYVARLSFDVIAFSGNMMGTAMGFASANTYDAHQESQTQVVAQIQTTLAMLLFLALDGHHMMLRATLDSYHVVGLGRASFGQAFSQKLVELTGQVIRLGIQLSAPIALSMFAINVAMGILAKTMPQLNILVLSFTITALVGLVVLLIGLPEMQSVTGEVLGKMEEWLQGAMGALRS